MHFQMYLHIVVYFIQGQDITCHSDGEMTDFCIASLLYCMSAVLENSQYENEYNVCILVCVFNN